MLVINWILAKLVESVGSRPSLLGQQYIDINSDCILKYIMEQD